MKKFRKIMAVLVAAIMVVAMTVPAFADPADNVATDVTINFDLSEGLGETITAVTKTIPANSKYLWYEIDKTTDTPPTGSATGTTFLGWSDTEGGTVPVNRLLLDRTKTSVTLYAIWGQKGEESEEQNFTETGNIYIKNAVKGETYKAYQLLKLFSFYDDNVLPDSHTADVEAYAYYMAQQHPLYDVLKDYKFTYTNDSDEEVEEYAFEFYDGAAHTTGSVANPNGNQTITVSETFDGTAEDVVYTPVRVNPNFMKLAKNGTADEATQEEYQAPAAAIQAFAMSVKDRIDNLGEQDAAKLAKYGKVVSTSEGGATGDTVTFSGVPLGYYLVGSTLGSLCSLDTTNENAYVIEKNELSVMNKAVYENNGSEQDDEYGDKNDADFFETVSFKSTLTIPLRQSNVVYHDIIKTPAFDFNFDSITLAIDNDSIATVFAANNATADTTTSSSTYYTIYKAAHKETVAGVESPVEANFPTDATASLYTGDTFAIAFDNQWTENLTAPVVITITYTAVLTDEATVGLQTGVATGSGNDNQSSITFGDKQRTAWDWTRTYTWEYDVFKYAELTNPETKAKSIYADPKTAALAGYIVNPEPTDTDAEAATYSDYWLQVKKLPGARFTVKRDGSALDLTLISAGDADGTTASEYRLAKTGETPVTYIETPASGVVHIKGLDANSYVMEETQTPTGYYKLKDNISFDIDSNTDTAQGADSISQAATMSVKIGAVVVDKGLIKVLNFTGNEMPQTGGMGTTVLYIVGGMLVILAGAYLFFSRKKTA